MSPAPSITNLGRRLNQTRQRAREWRRAWRRSPGLLPGPFVLMAVIGLIAGAVFLFQNR